MPQVMQPIATSRKEANAIKKGQPITVVIGNPPYKEKAEGRGGWIEAGSGGNMKAPMDWWRPPVEWGVSAHTKHLKNLYVYFWRWATWKVFGTGNYAATGTPDRDEEGVICYITVAGFLNGPGFQKMREDLRRTATNIWVIDCSPRRWKPCLSTLRIGWNARMAGAMPSCRKPPAPGPTCRHSKASLSMTAPA